MSKYENVSRFLDVVARLRAPNGCPWDREQNHKSLKTYLVEECYEVIDAIDSGKASDIREELGDLFLQIALHAQIAADNKNFTIDDVASDIANKMIRRHPHVFGTAKAKTAGHVLKNWEIIKDSEKATKGIKHNSILEGVPKSFPALFEAYKISKKAAKTGFDWQRPQDVAYKLTEEMSELKTAIKKNRKKEIVEEIGDVLFTLTNVCRLYNINPEIALKQSNKKFRTRFAAMENILTKEKTEPKKVPFKRWQDLWAQAKKTTKIIFIFMALAAPFNAYAKRNDATQPVTESAQQDAVTQDNEQLLNAASKGDLCPLNTVARFLSHEQLKQAQALGDAVAAFRSGSYQQVVTKLKDIPVNSILDPYARYYRARALMATRDFSKALEFLLSQKLPSKKIAWDLFWLRAEALAQDKQTDVMTSEINSLKSKPTDKWDVIKKNYLLGLGSWVKGDKEKAHGYFVQVLVANPGTHYDQKIFRLHKQKGLDPDLILNESQFNQRADNLIKAGSPHEAVKIWQRYYAQNDNYLEKMAYGFFKARDYRAAAPLYEKLIARGDYTEPAPNVYTKLAQAYARYDSFDHAIATNKIIIKKFPATKAAGDSENKLGFLYFDSGRFNEAINYLSQYITKGTAKQKSQARWYRFWSYYFLKKYPSALEELVALGQEKNRDYDSLQLQYLKARVLDKNGQGVLAKGHYQKVADSDPAGYYGLLARQRLRTHSLTKTLIDPNLFNFVPSLKREPKASAGSLNDGGPTTLAVMLNAAGLDNYAYDESGKSALNNAGVDGALGLQLACNFNRGMALGRRTAANSSSEETAYFLSYPKAFAQYITTFSSHWGLDQNLAWAIMRQESAFKPEAQSWAMAYGLMQIIPPTGAEIAADINFKGYHTGLLNEPRINTLFGTYYLSKLQKIFSGELVYTIAAYNAGPDAVKRWTSKPITFERDDFVELIPYKETKNYVKRVLINYMIYKKLYE